MRRIAAIATTLLLLAFGVAATLRPVLAQSLSNAGGDSSGSSSGSGTSTPDSGSEGGVTANPGSGVPAGTSTSLVPVSPGSSSDDAVPNTTESSNGQHPTTHGAANPGDSGSSTNAQAASPASGSNISSLMGSGGNEPARYDENGEPYSRNYFQATPLGLQISMRRLPGLNPGQFQLHIAAHFQITSCIHFSKIPSEVKFSEDGTVKIEVKEFTVDLRDLASEHDFGCQPKTTETPAADVVLDRDDLKKRGTHRIVFTTKDGTNDRYDVTLTDHQIRLQPSKESRGALYVRPSTPGILRNPMQHWFYPPGTLILSVQGAPAGQNLDDEIDRAARRHGLVPLVELWPEFKQPLTTPGLHYYVDKKNAFKGVSDGQAAVIGNITVNKTVYGLQGDELETKELPVYGRAPTADE